MKQIVRAALKHYPNSKHLRREYISKTAWLISTEHHALLTGGWRREGVR